jgi:anti-sigma factor RsiW
MNCKHVQNRLSAYLDGELAGSEMLEVRHHVQECACCAREAEELLTLKSMLANGENCAPPADFEARLVAHVFKGERAASTPTWRANLGIAGVAAAAAAAAFVLATKASEPIRQEPAHEVAYSDMAQDQTYFQGMDPIAGGQVVPVNYAGH